MLLNNVIEFNIHKDLSKIDSIKPYPIRKSLPEWFKKVSPHTIDNKNIKGCIPFLDSISAGYVLPLPQDLHIVHNRYNPDTENKESYYKFALSETLNNDDCVKYNMNTSTPQHHPLEQVGGSCTFMANKNGNVSVIKILNPWKIKTPKGYSCLFVSPFYNEMDHFYIINAIVDTDRFHDWINFPILINNDKYPSFDKIFKQGTPYVQIIPFKRENWKLKINGNAKPDINHRSNYFTKFINRYKNMIWVKKKWN